MVWKRSSREFRRKHLEQQELKAIASIVDLGRDRLSHGLGILSNAILSSDRCTIAQQHIQTIRLSGDSPMSFRHATLTDTIRDCIRARRS